MLRIPRLIGSLLPRGAPQVAIGTLSTPEAVDDAGKIRVMSIIRLTANQRRRVERDAPARSADDRTVLVGMKRPATPAELRAFVEREQARIRAERDLSPSA